jgi:hypothetical protein
MIESFLDDIAAALKATTTENKCKNLKIYPAVP